MELILPFFSLLGRKIIPGLSRNLRTAMPELSEDDLKAIRIYNLKHLGKSLVELMSFPKLDKKKLQTMVEVKGLENLERAYKNGKGAIIITAHYGNWELLMAYIANIGFPLKTLATKTHNDVVNNLLVELRKKNGFETIYREESAWKMIKLIKKKVFFVMLIDQDTKVDGIFADFFGKPTYTPKGPAILAMRTGAPLIPAFIRRKPDGKHKLIIEEPVNISDTGEKEKDIIITTEKMNALIEKHIRAYPEQWSLMQRRWKTES